MTTVLEINLTTKEILKKPAIIKIAPVQNKTLGITESANSFRVLSSVIIPHEIKTPKSKTAVAFVGPKVMNLSLPQIPPTSAATPDPTRPKCKGNPAIKA